MSDPYLEHMARTINLMNETIIPKSMAEESIELDESQKGHVYEAMKERQKKFHRYDAEQLEKKLRNNPSVAGVTIIWADDLDKMAEENEE